MKPLMLMAALLLAGAAQAGDAGLCKPLCDSDKRECRKDAASQADDDTLPLMPAVDRNPNARVSRELSGKPTVAQTRQGHESRRVQLQRTCDTQYQRCVQACAREDAAQPLSGK